MEEQKLYNVKEIQKQLDEKKWFESQIARMDLTGKMFYCEKCPCLDKFNKTCTVDQQYRENTCQCAYMEIERKKLNTLVITPRFSSSKKTSKKSSKKIKPDPHDDEFDGHIYSLFDVTKKELEEAVEIALNDAKYYD